MSPQTDKTTGGEPPLFNIANILTIVRLILVPLFIVVYWVDTPVRACVAFVIFVVAALTDKLDGHLARSRGLITNFGKLADSIADKALISAALIMLSWHGYLWWWVTILMIGRELLITAVRMSIVKKYVMPAAMGGKMKMVFQSIGIGALLLPWRDWLPWWYSEIFMWIGYIALGLALYYSIVSAYGYIRDAWRIAHEE
ncbi:MAG: CDP-diacylglycerol--glycerol-3-phosphate 3-phosphatidyltransferase [Actinomycetaceae bacterium]|nr:CDP-diacylglycerol--glycerol-3-phosphate 3-phosphatidyltransferase [Actinomycetaceae bacterium]